jgi:hypothetical protein
MRRGTCYTAFLIVRADRDASTTDPGNDWMARDAQRSEALWGHSAVVGPRTSREYHGTGGSHVPTLGGGAEQPARAPGGPLRREREAAIGIGVGSVAALDRVVGVVAFSRTSGCGRRAGAPALRRAHGSCRRYAPGANSRIQLAEAEMDRSCSSPSSLPLLQAGAARVNASMPEPLEAGKEQVPVARALRGVAFLQLSIKTPHFSLDWRRCVRVRSAALAREVLVS